MTPADRVIDASLVLKAQTGNVAAFEELVRRHDAPLRYYVRRLVGDRAQADDIVQDAWLAALRQIRLLRDAAAFKVWLCRTARNLCASHVRWLRSHRTVPWSSEDEETLARTDSGDSELAAFRAAQLHAAIAALPDEHREVIALRFVQEMSYEEIATVLDCPLGTVRSRLHYAKRELARACQSPTDDVTL